MKQTHVYADSKEEAVKQLEKEGYEVIEWIIQNYQP
jgi:hypothetical protein